MTDDILTDADLDIIEATHEHRLAERRYAEEQYQAWAEAMELKD